MRSKILHTLILITFSYALSADLSLGVKVGCNLSIEPNKKRNSDQMELGYNLGIWKDFPISKNISIISELAFTNRIWHTLYSIGYYRIQKQFGSISMYFIDVPVLITYKTSNKLKIYCGPSISYYLNGKWRLTSKIFERTLYGDEILIFPPEKNDYSMKSKDLSNPSLSLVLGEKWTP